MRPMMEVPPALAAVHRARPPRGGSRRRFARACAVATLGVAALAGCASTLSTQVTTFRNDFDAYAGKHYEIRPSAEQRDSLEFEAFASALRAALEREGMVRAATGEVADLAVMMRYSVTPSQAATRAGGGTIGIGAGGGGFSMGSLGVGVGISLPLGGGRDAEVVGYRREVQVQIDRLGDQGSRVFEGKAVSDGSSASLAPVMPAMLRALFDRFPGANGTTRVVEVPLEGAARD